MNKPVGELKTVIEIARLIGKNPRYVRDLIDMGCPLYERNSKPKPHIIDMAQIWDFAVERNRAKLGRPPAPINEADPKVRANAAVAEMKELELSQRRGELFPIAELDAFLKETYVELRRHFTELAREQGGAPLLEIADKTLHLVAERYRTALAEIK